MALYGVTTLYDGSKDALCPVLNLDFFPDLCLRNSLPRNENKLPYVSGPMGHCGQSWTLSLPMEIIQSRCGNPDLLFSIYQTRGFMS